ncbi:alpha-N-acetylglucosaminidase [Spirosoma oryzae]|uniref:Alpha-N-acetylglucosaminidase n=1 Tax=Spirosoma oryzae TaxID=1469603 RepID=A0A2T0T365_9BACT|nr:alpha-N-acetylglucosaminidase [Spirosoma oryzae]PRY40128.1 alpha-N-acetylglucosaminidase [Spirosoma oryzae]
MPLRLSLFLITLCIANLTQAQSATPGLDERATYALIKRILPSHAQQFTIAPIPKDGDHDAFELESQGGKIVLRGNNGVSVASALKHYLNEYAHCDISWNGTNLNLPSPLPVVPKKVHKTTPYQYRYYLNYCTFNYTMSWWDWPRWQQEIDWMALNGINLPLAITGQNSIWDRVYKSMGLTDKDLASFYSGPTFFNWFWMGNIDGWGGPLPHSFMERHEALQKQILARERELGMTPILPAFTGHVPPAFKDKFPKANVKRTNWDAGFDDVFILDPEDPLFPEIGRRFIQEEIKTFGTDHLYTADTFNENIPPTNDSTFLAQAGSKVYQAMAAVDPKAVWIMQGWLFVYQAKFWQQPQIRALLSGVPDDKMLILDLWSETKPAWRDTKAYYGKPWLWCMLQNFGGNIGMFGRMENVANDPANALHDPNAGKLRGIGLTPEGIEQNPALFALMLDNVWRDQPIQLDSWLNDYAHRRYGKVNADAEAAWQILRKTVYNGGLTEGTPESIISARPTFAKDGHRTLTTLNYTPADLLPAWDHFLNATNTLQTSDGFRYDLVDLTRQVLANHANALQQQCARDYDAKDTKALDQHSRQFLTLIDDMDRLLATRSDFLLGRWLESAKAWGQSPAEKALYEQNARDLITLWGDKNSPLHDYSNRQWSGLLRSFYKPRWQQFFDKAQASLKTGKPLDLTAFDQQMRDWEWNWVNSREPYPTTPTGSSVDVAKALYKQYRPVVVTK